MSNNNIGLRQLKDGTWAWRFTLRINGKSVSQRGSKDVNGMPFKTKSAASKARKEAILKAQSASLQQLPTSVQQLPISNRKTVEEVFTEFCENGRSDRAYQTKRKQDSLWQNHLREKFGKCFVDAIPVQQIQDYLTYLYYEAGSFIVVEDSGTVGLTGKNTPAEKINQMMANGEALPSSERLSRFTSMFNSGGNTTGGGLFGAGKSVYSVASQTYTYYFDSLREDGLYVANINKCGQVMSVALEGIEAKEYIIKKTGLVEKKTTGTRVIIEKPNEELADSIRNGSIIPFIQESWWLIIQRLDDTSSISVNGTAISVPDGIKKGSHVFDLQNPETYTSNYKVPSFQIIL